MVFAHHVTDDTGGFFVGLVWREAVFVHGVKDAAMDGFQTVANVRKSAAHDYAHGVFEIAFLHFVFDGDVGYFTGIGRRNQAFRIVVVAHWQPLKSKFKSLQNHRIYWAIRATLQFRWKPAQSQ